MKGVLLASTFTVCILALSSSVLVHASGIHLTDKCTAEDPRGLKLRATRDAVAQECSCSATTSHSDYVACAAAAAERAVARGNLPQSCRSAVKVCAAKTTCGRHGGGWVACCLNAGSGRMCRMAGSVTACQKMRGTPNTHVPACTSCCDACPNPGQGSSCGSAAGGLIGPFSRWSGSSSSPLRPPANGPRRDATSTAEPPLTPAALRLGSLERGLGASDAEPALARRVARPPRVPPARASRPRRASACASCVPAARSRRACRADGRRSSP